MYASLIAAVAHLLSKSGQKTGGRGVMPFPFTFPDFDTCRKQKNTQQYDKRSNPDSRTPEMG